MFLFYYYDYAFTKLFVALTINDPCLNNIKLSLK